MDAVQRGSDPLGWSRAATYFSRYTGARRSTSWEAYPSRDWSPQPRSRPDRGTGKPVGRS